MNFLLVVYFFCLTTAGDCVQGQVYQEKYDVKGYDISTCMTLGRIKAKELQHKHDDNGDFSFMCIRQGEIR